MRVITLTEKETEKSHVGRSYSPELRLATGGMDTAEPILKELCDFRKDNNE